MRSAIPILLSVLFFLGCSSRPTPLPAKYKDTLAWGAVDLDRTSRAENSTFYSMGTALAQTLSQQETQPLDYSILAISGGGSRGAFGTGFIDGWFEGGTMPVFNVVTGVSTGAIMAPFVFLHDRKEIEKIKYFYTHITTSEVFQYDWLHAIGDGYIANANPLEKLLDETVDATFLQKIADEHRRGRRLYIGTTNLDTGKFTVWDMGAIASSDREDRLSRFKKLILASSALPAFVPPQYIGIDIDNTRYYQMHVDGGVYNQIFIIGLLEEWDQLLQLKDLGDAKVTLYMISNRKYRQRDFYEPVEQNMASIVKAYVLTEMDLLFDKSVYRIYTNAHDKGYGFKMVSIPNGMKPIIERPTRFEPEEMKRLFDMGKEMGEHPQWKERIGLDEYDRL